MKTKAGEKRSQRDSIRLRPCWDVAIRE
ncbi:UNVERIFIED_CONTAM: hypothetical protein GTU68_052940 [Idotea baltica]|nr:hypothetical protein [Idotea baltica]